LMAGWSGEQLQVIRCRLQVTGCRLQITDYRFKVKNNVIIVSQSPYNLLRTLREL